MLLVLSGAKKNIGDFLIVDRTLRLLERVLDEEVIVHPRWQSLDGMEDVVSRARAIVVAGGPGVTQAMYPKVYALFSEPEKLAVIGTPIRFLGVGWFSQRGDTAEMRRFRFTDETRALFESMGEGVSFSTRDGVTADLLKHAGIQDVTMSGCPVFYDLRHLGEPYQRPSEVRTIVFTTPQNSIFEEQSTEVLASVMKRFPAARVIASFHRGIEADEFTPPAEAERLQRMAARYVALGAEVRDVSYDLSRIDFYDDADLHVGYRVHAHLRFISGRKPSFLLEEDGRGRGFARVLSAPSIAAWRYTPYGSTMARVVPRLPGRLRRRLPLIAPAGSTVADLGTAIDRFDAGDDTSFEAAVETIEATFPVMKGFIERI